MRKFTKNTIKKAAAALMLAALCIVMFKAGEVSASQTGTPGSVNDPLITKSYLDKRLEEFDAGNTATADSKSSAGMEKLQLSKSVYVSAKEGTMIVLMEGSAYASGDGLINITKGEALSDGMTVSKYNTFLVTKDNTGIKADSSAVVYIAGEYTLK